MKTEIAVARPQQARGFVTRSDDDGHVIEDAAGRARFRLNGTALALWQLCDGHTSVAEILDAMCDLFAAPRRQLEHDLERTLTQLRHVGLLVDAGRDE